MNTDHCHLCAPQPRPSASTIGVRLRLSAVPRIRSSILNCALSFGLWSLVSSPTLAQNQTINGNLTVTGTIGSAGAIDSDANTFSFGTQGGSYGAALLYQDNSTDTFTFSANRNPASWLWLHTTAIAAMRLDTSHQLILYKSDGTSAGVTLMPASNAIKLGTHANGTLTADANGVITAGGGLAVVGNFTNANAAATTSFMGNVGIGTASPSRKLTVQGDGLFTDGIRGALIAHDGYGGGRSFLVLDVDAADGVGSGGDYIYLAQETAQGVLTSALGTPLGLGSGAATMTIMPSGNVGIGTAAPGERLEVGGAIKATAAAVSFTTANAAVLDFSNSSARLTAGANGPNHRNLELRALNAGTPLGGQLYLQFDGNVGVGTTNPQRNLTVVGAGMATLQLADGYNGSLASDGFQIQQIGTNAHLINTENGFLSAWTNATERLRIDAGGNVGIGTATPSRPLVVAKDGADEIGSTFRGVASFFNSAVSKGLYIGYDAAEQMASLLPQGANSGISFWSHNGSWDERMRIAPSGNVGIGTTTPTHKLHVVGTLLSDHSTTPGFYMFNGAVPLAAVQTNVTGGILNIGDMYSAAPSLALGLYTADVERLRIDATGNVGIGTASPTHKLAVNGTIRAKEVIVDTGWADYVFEDDYRLAPLVEVEQHIREKKHLPGIPSAAEVEQGGVSLGEMQASLLAKVEELTLHLIAQEKRLSAQDARLVQLETENRQLHEKLSQP